MPFYDPIRIGASGTTDTAFTVDRSLRFNDNDTAYLSRNFGTGGNRKKWTFSAWIKRGNLGDTAGEMRIFGGSTNASHIFFASNDELTWDIAAPGSSASANLNTTQVFRDVSAWFHLVCALDTDNSTADNRMRIYINGTEVTSFGTRTNPSSGYASNAINADAFADGDRSLHTIGYRTSVQGSAGMEFDGYMAEINFIDGQQYDPSYFGETNPITGQWNPKKYVGGYGTTGFYLPLTDNSGTSATTLGKDSSGNSNNFTPNNFVTGDAVKDTPTNNFSTMRIAGSPASSGCSLSEGNLRIITGSSGSAFNLNRIALSTFLPTSGKWYAEAKVIYYPSATSQTFIGVATYQVGTSPTSNLTRFAAIYGDDGDLYINTNGSQTISSHAGDMSTNDIVGVYVDMDASTPEVYFAKNGQWANGSGSWNQSTPTSAITLGNTFFTEATGGSEGFALFLASAGATFNVTLQANFGQDSTFSGGNTAGGNTDANGIGDFKYTVPTGAKAMCSANLPDPTILLPNKHFDTLLYTGNGSTQSITGLNFQPDWVWIKKRDSGGSTNHHAFDSVRGVHKHIPPNTTSSETTDTNSLTSFDSDGFSLGNYNLGNLSSKNIVAWNWNAGDSDSKTYTVTVVDDSGNKYRFDGFGTSAVTLDLAEGGTYIFNYPSAHPFRFSETADGTHGGGSEYTTGVTVLSSTSIQIVVAVSAPTLYYYCSSHSGMGGAINTNTTLGSSNFDGSVQSICKVNASGGFSVTRYTGTGGNITVGHGLGVTPQVNLTKSLTATSNWTFLHTVYDGSYDRLYLNSAGAYANSSITAPTSTVFSRTSTDANNEGMICYSFSSVKGYSKIGYYTGNNSSDGVFVHCGFRPAWIMIKGRTGSRHWVVKDNKRNTFNVANASLLPNSNTSEDTSSSFDIDILSNGFKCRTAGTHVNDAVVYIFMAFAESSFKNARAR